MTRLVLRLAAASLVVALGASLAQAAPSEKDMKRHVWTWSHSKRAECLREARAMHFGVHFIKRARFIRECMARN